ncbi:hypothetical protein M2352_005164 [Azospirillum fermentarium]|uniref:hypothetical protein n=1 Tax=Azospirillum fermentarium TaxID=1233114 RepID=UPI0022278B9B|nr:hypothetical protein [Azospirillum fermentarium]MCW2249481.1 hypothetical protein [Azospirillum fermentarium]
MHREIASIFAEAFSAHKEGNYEKCLSLSKQVTLVDNGNADAQHMIAVSSHKLKKYKDAVDSIMCAAAYNINNQSIAFNFREIIRAAASHLQKIECKKEKEDIILSLYKAAYFSSFYEKELEIEFSFPILVNELIRIGYNQEAINIARLSFKTTSHTEIPLMCTHILLDLGLIDEECLRNSADLGVRFIRKNENLPLSFASILHWCYWKNNYKSLNFFLGIMKKKMSEKEILSSKVLHAWHMIRIDNNFYKNHVYQFNSTVTYEKNQSAKKIEGEGIVLVSVDENYWNRFARQMVEDLLLKSHTFPIHACIMNASASTQSFLAEWAEQYPRFGYSVVETKNQKWISDVNKVAFGKTYFACNRFMMMEDVFNIYGKPIIVLDGDQVPVGDMDEFIHMLLDRHNGDIAIHYGTRLGPGREMVCDLAVFRPTPGTHLFFSLLKRYMGYFLSQDYALWTLDQVAFYAVLFFLQKGGMAPRLSLIEQEKFPFHRYLFHPLDSMDKDAMIHAKRMALAAQGGQ